MAMKTSFRHRATALILACVLSTSSLVACARAVTPSQSPSGDVSLVKNDYEYEPYGEYESYAVPGDGAMAAEVGEGYWPDPSLEVEFNTEEYDALNESGFILVATKPLSTVSADVDTASWCNLRRMAHDGYGIAGKGEENVEEIDDYGYYYGDAGTIPAGAVRIEEMLNYFSYDYAAPAKGERFSVTTHLGPCPWNSETELLTLGFATAPEDGASEKGRNLVFLIDVSGSMDSRDKLELLQDAFEELIRQLDANDRVSIVTYASGEELVLDGESGDNARQILKAVRGLEADGATNGERGLQLAYEVAERNFIEGGVNRIIMASDGDLNVGMSSESDLHDYVSKKRETGVYLSVLGFGSGNYKDNKMETLADDGNGSYHYIDCIEEAERVFGENLCANLVPFADDVKVQVEFNPSQVKAYRLIGYENRSMADEDFRDDTADAGDVGPGAQFTVAYEIVRADSDFEVSGSDLKYQESVPTGSDEWLTATLRYHAFDDDKVHEQAVVVGDDVWVSNPGDDWNFQAAIIELGMLMRGSEHAGTSSLDDVRTLAGSHDDFIEVVDDLDLNS